MFSVYVQDMQTLSKVKSKSPVKSVKILDVIANVTEDGKDILSVRGEWGDGSKVTLDVPFKNCTTNRLKEVGQILLGRTFVQAQPEIPTMRGEPIATFETIHPFDAFFFLARNPSNRAVKMDCAEKYTHAMLSGMWKLTCQGLGFDTNGELVNGQHTLWACLIADKAFPTLLVRGLDPDTKGKIDTNAVRTTACLLEMDPSNLNLATLPAMATMVAIGFRIFMIAAGTYKNVWNSTTGNAMQMIKKYQGALRWLKAGDYASPKGVTRDFSKAPILAGLVIAHKKYPKETEEFAKLVWRGSADERRANPAVYALWDYLDKGKVKTANVKTDSVFVQTLRVLRGIQAYIEGEASPHSVTSGFPRTTEGEQKLISFFCVNGDKRKLLPKDIDLSVFEAMMHVHQDRVGQMQQSAAQ